jgi:hypothetical protein
MVQRADGLGESGADERSPSRRADPAADPLESEAMGTPLRAGVATVPLDPPLGIEMMGYGARTGRAQARHDPLTARACYLAAASDLLVVALDVCLVAPVQAEALRREVERKTGVARDRILVGSIHTHSGPDTGFAALIAGREPPAHVPGLFDAALRAAEGAVSSAAPARLGLARAEARIGRNRRRADGPLDPEVLVARVDRADGRPLAVLFVHGCHPTALGHDNLVYSADWPWSARDEIESALPGATSLFLLGAHSDVDPRTRGLLDLAIPNQSVGVGFDEVERLGREIGRAVAEAAGGAATSASATVGAASARTAIPVHGGELEGAEYEAWLGASRAVALAALGFPSDAELRTADFYRLERERTEGLDAGERRECIARVRRYLRDRTAPRFAFARVPEVETQVLRLGDALLVGLPLEPTVDVGLDWKTRIAPLPGAVLGIANGWIRYLPHPRNFAEPEAHLKYEILQSTLVPDAATRLLDAAQALAEELAA